MSGGRIELPMSEYNGMKERIEELEKELVEKNKELEKCTDKLLSTQNHLDDILSLSLVERVFKWKKNLMEILDKE